MGARQKGFSTPPQHSRATGTQYSTRVGSFLSIPGPTTRDFTRETLTSSLPTRTSPPNRLCVSSIAQAGMTSTPKELPCVEAGLCTHDNLAAFDPHKFINGSQRQLRIQLMANPRTSIAHPIGGEPPNLEFHIFYTPLPTSSFLPL